MKESYTLSSVLKIIRDKKGEICKHNAHLVVSGDEGGNCQQETFCSVSYYLLIKLTFCSCIRWDGQ